MYMAIILLFLLFIGNILVKRAIRKPRKVVKRKPIDVHSEYLDRIKALDRFDPEGYTGETKRRISDIKKRIYEVLEDVLREGENGDLDSQELAVKALESEFETFVNDLQRSIRDWENVERKLKKDIELAQEFLKKHTFAPKEVSTDVKKIEMKIEKLRDVRREDPLSPFGEYEKLDTDFRESLVRFTSLHEKAESIIRRIEPLKIKLHNGEFLKIVKIQQEVYFLLQNNEFGEAEKRLKELSFLVDKKEKKKSIEKSIE